MNFKNNRFKTVSMRIIETNIKNPVIYLCQLYLVEYPFFFTYMSAFLITNGIRSGAYKNIKARLKNPILTPYVLLIVVNSDT